MREKIPKIAVFGINRLREKIPKIAIFGMDRLRETMPKIASFGIDGVREMISDWYRNMYIKNCSECILGDIGKKDRIFK